MSEVNLALTALPSGVQCIQVNLTSGGSTLASQNFTATANWTGTVGLGTTFTKGTVSVGANAYNAACSALAGVTPTWVSDAVSVDVTPGRPNPVTLNFRQNFGVSASANFAPTVVDLSLGAYSTGLVFSDGTVKVVGLAQPPGLTSVVELALGASHACARKTDGTVWCWGDNAYGQLGNGTTTSSATVLVQVTGITGATRLAANQSASCATVAPNNTLMCWGSNSNSIFRDLGGNRLTPSVVAGGDQATKVSLGSNSMCYIKSDALAVACGGYNGYGQLGLGTTDSEPYGGTAGDMSAQSVGVGGFHACAAGPDGRVRCWGANYLGQLGLGNLTSSSVPVVLTTLTGVEELAATTSGACARTVAGVVSCWGDNTYGTVGDGTNAQRLSPVQVLTGSKKLRAGPYHACSLQADASVKCWGYNAYGELLDGTNTTSDLPISAKL